MLLAFVLYGHTIPHGYAFDDAICISENTFTRQGLAGIKNIFSSDSFAGYKQNISGSISGGRYRPLSIATFAVEHQFFGLNPHVSHFVNVLLYALTGMIIFAILSRLLNKGPPKNLYLAAPCVATVLYLAHPIHTEVVANIKGRDEILALLFSLSALWSVLKYCDTRRAIYLALGCAAYCAALFSKEIAVTFILIIALVLYFFLGRPLKTIARIMAPLVVVALGFIAVRHFIIGGLVESADLSRNIMNNSFAAMTVWQKYATITYTLGWYLKLVCFPHPLTFDYYPYHVPIMEWSSPAVLMSLLICGFLFCFAAAGLKRRRFVSFCILLYLIPLSLTSNILFPVGAFMSERFLYISSLGFVLLITHWFVQRPGKPLLTMLSAPGFFLAAILALYALKTIDRNRAWKDTFTLLETDVQTSQDSAKSTGDFGSMLYDQANASNEPREKAQIYERAFQHLEKSFSINPKSQKVNFLLGTIWGKYKGDLDKSIYYLNNAMNLNPSDIDTYNNLGIAYGTAKQYAKAIETFERGLKVSPQDKSLLSNLSATYQALGKMDKAEEYLQRATGAK